MIWSRSFCGVRFQIFLMTARNSSLAWSILPSVLIFNDVRINAKRVALNITVPSWFNGMFIETNFYSTENTTMKFAEERHGRSDTIGDEFNTLQATLCGQSLPKPSGGEIFLSSVMTSRCLIRPLNRTRTRSQWQIRRKRKHENSKFNSWEWTIPMEQQNLPCTLFDEDRAFRILTAAWYFAVDAPLPNALFVLCEKCSDNQISSSTATKTLANIVEHTPVIVLTSLRDRIPTRDERIHPDDEVQESTNLVSNNRSYPWWPPRTDWWSILRRVNLCNARQAISFSPEMNRGCRRRGNKVWQSNCHNIHLSSNVNERHI